METLLWFFGTILFLSIYFFPTIIAGIREHKQGVAILVLNLFLGWTLVGWVISLVWAVKD